MSHEIDYRLDSSHCLPRHLTVYGGVIMEYTVIHGKNRVTQYDSYIGIDRDIKSNFIAVNISGVVSRRGSNPIVWPVPCEIGLQAIVDMKRGTLRFGHDELIGVTEFVVSTYGDSGTVPKPALKEFTSIEDAPHPFDSVCFWPLRDPNDTGHKVHTEGWKWIWFGGDWILSNGTVGLTRNDWEKYDNKMAPAQPMQSPVHVLHLIGEWPKAMPPQCELELIKNCEWKYVHGEWVLFDKFSGREFHEDHWLNYHENLQKHDQPLIPSTREEVMALVDVWPTDWNKSGEKINDDWIWAVLGGRPVIINQTDNVNLNTVITESEWREYKNKPLGTKADDGKVMMDTIPPHAELAVARVLTFGAKKYSRGNWAHVENSDERYMDAALRHINAYRRGEQTDSETGENHLAHAICCLMFMLDNSESK